MNQQTEPLFPTPKSAPRRLQGLTGLFAVLALLLAACGDDTDEVVAGSGGGDAQQQSDEGATGDDQMADDETADDNDDNDDADQSNDEMADDNDDNDDDKADQSDSEMTDDDDADHSDDATDDSAEQSNDQTTDDEIAGGDLVQTVSHPELISARKTPIAEVATIDEQTLGVRYQAGAEPCSLANVTLTESDDSVTVLLETGLNPDRHRYRLGRNGWKRITHLRVEDRQHAVVLSTIPHVLCEGLQIIIPETREAVGHNSTTGGFAR